MSAISIGNELKDSFKEISKWIVNGISWIDNVQDFYKDKALLEKEYSIKLKDICRKHYEKKSKMSSILSVGDKPRETPGSLENASLKTWSQLLMEFEGISDCKLKFYEKLIQSTGTNFSEKKKTFQKLLKRIEEIENYIVNEKNNTFDTLHKSQKNYYQTCHDHENVREKYSKSEKYRDKLDKKEIDMNEGKNNYLLNIFAANSFQNYFFNQYIPELSDQLQNLNELRVEQFNCLIKETIKIERDTNESIQQKLTSIFNAVEKNIPRLDILMFIDHNRIDFENQQEIRFIPCKIWLDTDTLVLKEPELLSLKKKYTDCVKSKSKHENICVKIKDELKIFNNSQNQPNISFFIFTQHFFDYLNNLHDFFKVDIQRIKNQAQVDLIESSIQKKDLSFVETKKTKKVTLDFFKKKKNTNETKLTSENLLEVNEPRVSDISLDQSCNGSERFLLRKNSSFTDNQNLIRDKPASIYNANQKNEISSNVNNHFEVNNVDNKIGEISISNNNETKSIPRSHISINKTGSKTPPDLPPKIKQKKNYYKALFNYDATEKDELSLKKGCTVILIRDDFEDTGWLSIEYNGKKGFVPKSYVAKL